MMMKTPLQAIANDEPRWEVTEKPLQAILNGGQLHQAIELVVEEHLLEFGSLSGS